jgi:hypothetical protein
MSNAKLKMKSIVGFLLLVTCSLAQASQTETPEISEPQYAVTDNNHVNLGSAGLYYRLPDVSIGQGQFALSHSISINSNELANLSSTISGYKDKFIGGIHLRYHTYEPLNSRFFRTIHVFDHEISADFIINSSGQFESIGDKRLQLTVADNNQFLLTKADGTRVFFNSTQPIPSSLSADYSPYGSMAKIEYTNGFIIDIHKDSWNIETKITSVNSNNGLQLKYIYEEHDRPLEASKLSATSNPLQSANSSGWSRLFPVQIIALNNASETCPILGNSCTLTGEWPTATYNWPDGMPRAVYIGQSVFTTTNSKGVTTEFHHTAIDEQEGSPLGGPLGQYFVPRITKVKNSQGLDISYKYDNVWNPTLHFPFLAFSSGGKAVLTEAINNGVTTSYAFRNGGMPYNRNYGMQVWSGGGYKPVNFVVRPANKFLYGDARVSAPYIVDTWDKTVYLEEDFANNVNQIVNKLDGTTTNYEYDDFGRLESIESDGVYKKITYPSNYYPGVCNNYRYCHKPVQVSDFHLDDFHPESTTPNYTTYTYHPSSGNVASVTYPKNNTTTPKTVYSYQQYNGRFLNASGTMTTSSQPIWLLSSEFSCQNSNVSGQECSGNDKVEIDYHYGSGSGSNNLFLQGKTITSQTDNKSLTYCDKYDKYGHKIESSLPKSGISDCNVGREY